MVDIKTIYNLTEGQISKAAIFLHWLVQCENLELEVQPYIGINLIVTNANNEFVVIKLIN